MLPPFGFFDRNPALDVAPTAACHDAGRQMMGKWSHEEFERAHERFIEVHGVGSHRRLGAWADMFTEDATYVEHHYGTFEGSRRDPRWISETMAQWPNSEMKEFPHDWCVCDEERGWWICQIENRFVDPGDGEVYEAYNLTG